MRTAKLHVINKLEPPACFEDNYPSSGKRQNKGI